MNPSTCGVCKKPIASGEAETCWWCTCDLCFGCWEALGHCGHVDAIAQERAAAERVGDTRPDTRVWPKKKVDSETLQDVFRRKLRGPA